MGGIISTEDLNAIIAEEPVGSEVRDLACEIEALRYAIRHGESNELLRRFLPENILTLGQNTRVDNGDRT